MAFDPNQNFALIQSIVGVAGGATRAALTVHQARRDNLADISAKDGSQVGSELRNMDVDEELDTRLTLTAFPGQFSQNKSISKFLTKYNCDL